MLLSYRGSSTWRIECRALDPHEQMLVDGYSVCQRIQEVRAVGTAMNRMELRADDGSPGIGNRRCIPHVHPDTSSRKSQPRIRR